MGHGNHLLAREMVAREPDGACLVARDPALDGDLPD